MNVPVRSDPEYGLTVAQFNAMPGKIRKRAAADPEESARLLADIPVWEAAAKQIAGKKGKFSITWSEVTRGGSEPAETKESDADVAEAEMTTETRTGLPDSAFADPGARKYPHHKADGSLDLPHLRNALSRVAQEDTSSVGKQHLIAHAREAGIGEFAEADPDLDAMTIAELREYGARNSGADLKRIQAAHDTMVSLGANCSPTESASAPAVTPAPVSEAEADQDAPGSSVTFREGGDGLVTFAEAGAEFDDAKREVWITPIRPGFGNRRDGFYYPTKAIREAVDSGLFNGLKMFANHPRRTDEKELPERSVKDWIGVIKETVWDEARGVPRSRLKVLDGDAYERFRAAPEHIAFSVLGQGTARPGRAEGREARIVEAVKTVKSVDWVTQGGAGGAIDFAESASEELLDIGSERTDHRPVAGGTAGPHRRAPARGGRGHRRLGRRGDRGLVRGDRGSRAPAAMPTARRSRPRASCPAASSTPCATRSPRCASRRPSARARPVPPGSSPPRCASPPCRASRGSSSRSRSARPRWATGCCTSTRPACARRWRPRSTRLQRVTDSAVGRRRSGGVTGLGAETEDRPAATLRESKEADIARRMGAEQLPKPRYGDETGTPASATSMSDASASVAAGIADRIGR